MQLVVRCSVNAAHISIVRFMEKSSFQSLGLLSRVALYFTQALLLTEGLPFEEGGKGHRNRFHFGLLEEQYSTHLPS